MTKKFVKEWGIVADNDVFRATLQRQLDGGTPIERKGRVVSLLVWDFFVDPPARAVKFAAALNKLRRPLHLIKQDLDADWALRVKERDDFTCVGCGVKGDKIGETVLAHTVVDEDTGEEREVKEPIKKDVLTAHHWLKTKSRAGMARWARPCGVTYHYAEHIHTLHENPCWMDLEPIYRHVVTLEGQDALNAALCLTKIVPTEAAVRALWLERCGKKETETLRYHPNPPREFS